jgi:hypothetical protein
MLGKMDCFGLTDRGRVRADNEDQFLIADLNKSMRIYHTSLLANKGHDRWRARAKSDQRDRKDRSLRRVGSTSLHFKHCAQVHTRSCFGNPEGAT